MTEMRRMSVAIPDELDKRLLALRRDDRFARCTYSEIVRRMLEQALDNHAKPQKANGEAG